MHRWQLRGVGHLDPQLVGDAAVIDMTDDGTNLIGTWEQGQLVDLIGAAMASGFELLSVRRLDAHS